MMVKSLKEKSPKVYDDLPTVTLSNCGVFDSERGSEASVQGRFVSHSGLSDADFRRFKILKCQALFMSVLEDHYYEDDDTYEECYGLFWSPKNACFYEIETTEVFAYSPSHAVFKKTNLESVECRLRDGSLGHFGGNVKLLFERSLGAVLSRAQITKSLDLENLGLENLDQDKKPFKRKI